MSDDPLPEHPEFLWQTDVLPTYRIMPCGSFADCTA